MKRPDSPSGKFHWEDELLRAGDGRVHQLHGLKQSAYNNKQQITITTTFLLRRRTTPGWLLNNNNNNSSINNKSKNIKTERKSNNYILSFITNTTLSRSVKYLMMGDSNYWGEDEPQNVFPEDFDWYCFPPSSTCLVMVPSTSVTTSLSSLWTRKMEKKMTLPRRSGT